MFNIGRAPEGNAGLPGPHDLGPVVVGQIVIESRVLAHGLACLLDQPPRHSYRTWGPRARDSVVGLHGSVARLQRTKGFSHGTLRQECTAAVSGVEAAAHAGPLRLWTQARTRQYRSTKGLYGGRRI